MPKIVAIVTVIMSLLLIQNGLIPMAATRSAKSVVSLLPAQGAVVASYGEYTTSAVFYSGYTIPSLLQKKNNQQQHVWSGKYTMPTEEIAVFDAYTTNHIMAYILVKNRDQGKFMNEPFAKKFHPIANYDNITLYQRRILP